MLDNVLDTCKYVVDNSKYVKINYNNIDSLIDELLAFNNVHYLTKVPYKVYDMSTQDIVNFLLIYDSIDFSFWGKPKWTLDNGLDGGIALLHSIYNLFKDKDSIEVYKYLENISIEEFSNILKGNIEIPLLKERYDIVTSIAHIANTKMDGNFYKYIENMNNDVDIFNTIITNFNSFIDTRIYNDKTIYFYKLAQLLTSDILHVIEIKENKDVDYSHLVGCADYKIPQVLNGLNILEYSSELINILDNKEEIEVNSSYEVEIRTSMIVVIDYIYNKINRGITRIDINDFIWSKGQDKTVKYRPYHLTRTTSY